MRKAPVVLPPAFVVGNPHHDGRDFLEEVYHPFELFAVEAVALRRLPFERVDRACVAARHVLKDEEPHLVAERVVSERFYLDMLAHRVEAAVLERLDVERHCLFRGRREEAVRPPALVQRSKHVVRFVVQEEPPRSIGIPALFEFSHSEPTLDRVIAERGGKIV